MLGLHLVSVKHPPNPPSFYYFNFQMSHHFPLPHILIPIHKANVCTLIVGFTLSK